jgi:hypothetical protein
MTHLFLAKRGALSSSVSESVSLGGTSPLANTFFLKCTIETSRYGRLPYQIKKQKKISFLKKE